MSKMKPIVFIALLFGALDVHAQGWPKGYALENLNLPQSEWLGYVIEPATLPKNLLAPAQKAPYEKYDYCPFVVTAIVEQSNKAQSFAMLDVDGEGQLVRQGQRIEYKGEVFKIRSLTSKVVHLRSGKTTLKCRLFK
tara:strand:- start:856 stop:1266 length:411 start_codon:yes stop_codon:yes gene_type:complete